MSHRVLLVGRPALYSAKQPSISYIRLQLSRRPLHSPISRSLHYQSPYRPVPPHIHCLPAKHPRRPNIRYCSYKNIMCRAKDGLAAASVDVSKGREVLPANVKPAHYSLTLEPNFEKFTYEGEVVIEYVKPKLQHLSRDTHFRSDSNDGC